MKLERNEAPRVFVPVTITLESQEEVNYFAALLGATTHPIDEAFGLTEADTYPLYCQLDTLSDSGRHRIESVKLKGGY